MKRASFSVIGRRNWTKPASRSQQLGYSTQLPTPRSRGRTSSAPLCLPQESQQLAGLTVEFLVNAQDAVPEFRLIDKERRLRSQYFQN